MASKKQTKSARQIWLDGFLDDDCCGNGHNSGYDVVWLACRHVNWEGREANAYYNMCDTCQDIRVICDQCVTEGVEEANS